MGAELVDDDTGLLVQPDSVDALIGGIKMLYEQDLALLGANARNKVCAQYSWGQILPQLFAHSTCLLGAPHQTVIARGVPYVAE